MAHKVAINCGHGTMTNGVWDSGCTYKRDTEAEMMLPITKACVAYLRKHGIKVLSDADHGNNRNMVADVTWANSERADLYVSVHCDYDKALSGTFPVYTSADGRRLAAAINRRVLRIRGMKTRGVCKRTDLYELNATLCPACIFEVGSIKGDNALMHKKAKKIGVQIAKGILDYLKK